MPFPQPGMSVFISWAKYNDRETGKSRLPKPVSTLPGLYTKGIPETPDVHPNPASPAVDLCLSKRGDFSSLSLDVSILA